jgi:hypothetical protein
VPHEDVDRVHAHVPDKHVQTPLVHPAGSEYWQEPPPAHALPFKSKPQPELLLPAAPP